MEFPQKVYQFCTLKSRLIPMTGAATKVNNQINHEKPYGDKG